MVHWVLDNEKCFDTPHSHAKYALSEYDNIDQPWFIEY